MSIVALGLASASVIAATVYKWVDEQGVIHYSDQPDPRAQKVEVESAQTFTSTPVPDAPSPSAPADAGPRYALCELYRPENDEVFLNTDTVTTKLRLQPQLQAGDRVAIALDGKRQTNVPESGSDFVLTNVTRGTHTVMAVIEDSQGKAVCTTGSITFHVRQPSVQAPIPSVRPKF